MWYVCAGESAMATQVQRKPRHKHIHNQRHSALEAKAVDTPLVVKLTHTHTHMVWEGRLTSASWLSSSEMTDALCQRYRERSAAVPRGRWVREGNMQRGTSDVTSDAGSRSIMVVLAPSLPRHDGETEICNTVLIGGASVPIGVVFSHHWYPVR